MNSYWSPYIVGTSVTTGVNNQPSIRQLTKSIVTSVMNSLPSSVAMLLISPVQEARTERKVLQQQLPRLALTSADHDVDLDGDHHQLASRPRLVLHLEGQSVEPGQWHVCVQRAPQP